MLATVGITAGLVLGPASPAGAASSTAKVQLSLTGLADSKNPVGGSVIGIRPGMKVQLSSASVPTAGLNVLGLDNLLGSLTNKLADFQITADLSKLPGGKKNTVLKGSSKATFAFPKVGTYKFTWTAQSVQLLGGLLGGSKLTNIKLNGNQLEKAGVKLNANNQYVGSIVVAKNPPKGGLSIQLPAISAEPEAPIVGKLPRVNIPGVNLPTVTVPSLGNLAPNLPGGNGGGNGGGGGSTGTPSTAPSSSGLEAYKDPGKTVPEMIVPGGSGADSGGSADFTSNGFAGLLPTTGGTGDSVQARNVSEGSGSSGGNGSSDGSAPKSDTETVELAADSGTPSGQLPVLLAILAILALALVAGTYARLYLLKKQ